MAVLVTDASALVYTYLKTSDDARAVAVRAALVSGADSVVESGDLTVSQIREMQDARPSPPVKALFVEVQDAGDSQIGAPGIYDCYVVVRVLDRGCSYRNIRTVKALLRDALRGIIGALVAGEGGVFEIRYSGRTGHRYDPIVAVEYDALTFAVPTALADY